MPKVRTCPHCDTPTVEAYNTADGEWQLLDLKPAPGSLGPYEIGPGNEIVPRLTKSGKPKTSGTGLRVHHCARGNWHRLAQVAPNADPAATAIAEDLKDFPPITHGLPPIAIEMQEVLGPQPRSGYVDITGCPTGPRTCAICKRAILVTHHALRPDGTRPTILDAQRHPRGRWRAYRKQGSNDIHATYAGNEYGSYFNHRLICPESRPETT